MSSSWTPLTYPKLLSCLADEVSALSDSQRLLWQLLELPQAELWEQHPWGNEGCGFWVIASAGRRCIYYNDIAQGFSIGFFQRWGQIQDYQPGGASLAQVLGDLTSLFLEPSPDLTAELTS